MFGSRTAGPWPPSRDQDPFTRIRPIIATVHEVVPGGILRAGKVDYGSGTGWWLGNDPADGESKFDIGTPTDYLRYDQTNGIQIAADGSGLTQLKGGHIQAASIILAGLASAVTDRMFDTATLSNNIQAWIHAQDATLIDGGNIYTGSILVAGLHTGIVERMFGAKATADNIQAWIHAQDATLIDGGKIYTDTVTATQIAANTITAGQIAVATITAAEIAAATITAAEIAATTITAAKLEIGTLTYEQLALGLISDNLITNAGFETGDINPHNIASHAGGTWSVQTTIKRSGAYALKYDPDGQNATAQFYLNGAPTGANYLYRHVAAVEGREFTFELYGYRAAGTTANRIYGFTRFYNATGSHLNSYYTTWDPDHWTDDTWTLETSTKTAPPGAAYVVWLISIANDADSGPVYLDDINCRATIGASLIQANCITASHIAAGTITAAEIAADAVTADKIDVTNLQAVSAQTGALTVDNTLTMGTDGIITWMSGAAKITDDYMDLALTATNRYAFRFLDDTTVHAYLAAYKSANLTQVSIEAIGPAATKYAKIALAAIESPTGEPETVDIIIRSDTGVVFSALNYGAARIFKVDSMDAYFTNKVEVAGNIRVDNGATQPVIEMYRDNTLYGDWSIAKTGADLRAQFKARNNAEIWLVDDSGQGLVLQDGGNLGLLTTTPGQPFDINEGSGNMIADGYDTHSLDKYKEHKNLAGDVLDALTAIPVYEYRRVPHVSADELRAAAIHQFRIKRWLRAFPNDDYRGGKLRDCPDPQILAFINATGDALRAKRRKLPKWQRKHYGLIADDPTLAKHLPSLISHNDDDNITGVSLSNQVGFLMAAVQQLTKRVEQISQ